MRRLRWLPILAVLAAMPARPQTWDTSGNGQLRGSYYFRQVTWLVSDYSGSLGRAIAIYGNISFDGSGKYTVGPAQVMDSNNGAPQSYTASGTYSIASSGQGFMTNPISSTDLVYGMVSKGIFAGSSTEGGFNDLFIAAPLASPQPTSSFFKGGYSMFDVDFPSGSPVDTRDSQFQLSPDGNGNLGTVTLNGLIAGRGSSAVSQTLSGIKYFFSNGAANISFGGSLSNTNLIAGTKYLYFSPDGEFVFGGSPTAWDMIVGVRSGSTSPQFGGLYYQAGVSQDESTLVSGYADLNTYYGSFKANGGTSLVHRRFLSPFNDTAIDSTYPETYTLKSDGTYDDSENHYIFGNSGALRLGLGRGPSLGVTVGIQVPPFPGIGVFIDPTGVVNAASSSQFSAGVAAGELVSIYGVNLAAEAKVDSSFPFELGGVQVMVNDRPAPIVAVGPNQISAVVPFGTTENIGVFQVFKSGEASNKVYSFVNSTAPGVFTQPPGGVGAAAALHSDFSPVTGDQPAHTGETIAVYVTGLGAVSPVIPDGTAGPVNPLSLSTNQITVYIGGKLAVTNFVGLAPQLVGLYQINFQVPAGVTAGSVALDVSGPDFYASGATIAVSN